MAHDPLSHVMDVKPFNETDPPQWVLFDSLFGREIYVPLPNIFGFQITKFMVLELIAAGLILAIYLPLARRARNGSLPKGPWWNAFESLLTFVRNEIAKPNIDPPPDQHGHHAEGHDSHAHAEAQPAHGEQGKESLVLADKTAPADDLHSTAGRLSEADKYVPFLWTVFLFVLFCNLLGLIPFMGSPTANIYVTGALALCSFVMIHGAAIVRMGPLRYIKSMWMPIDVPGGFIFSFLIAIIEQMGLVIKSGVLAIRLFANMFAGHMVLAMILLFIVTVGEAAHHFTGLWATVTVASVVGVTLLSLLELFVAFLQAYIFTFLTALFMGMALHPPH
jgi:F-type H+-transporting ATPase subunit a